MYVNVCMHSAKMCRNKNSRTVTNISCISTKDSIIGSVKMRKRERHREGWQRDRRGATGNGELNHFQLWERLLVSCADPGQRSGWRLSRENLPLKSSKTQAWGWNAAAQSVTEPWHPKHILLLRHCFCNTGSFQVFSVVVCKQTTEQRSFTNTQ